MSDVTTKLKLPYLQAAQAQKHVTHNEALERLDLLAHLAVGAFDATSPPISPVEGEAWALGLGAVNDWAGHDHEVAAWSNGGWLFFVPQIGWRAAMGTQLRIWTGNSWDPIDTSGVPVLQNLPGVGINTSSDLTNRLSLVSHATLLSHDGAGHQLKLNKASSADTGSLLFQTGWSGRAEMGTSGNDDFAIKVSADGTAWQTAISVVAGTAQVSVPQGLRAGDGSAALPSLGFASDPDTGVWRPSPDVLGVTVGGVERARITTAGITATGLIDGSAVTQTVTDQTTGRLLKTGDFGLGTALTLGAADDLDALVATGLYYNPASGNTAGNNYPLAAAGAVLNLRRTATHWVQTFVADGGTAAAEDVRQFTRSNGASGWTPWVEVIHQGRIVGTVSQAAGVPTGSVIERGANANGDYVRYADGTQICWHAAPALACETAQGPLWENASLQTWTFPVAFVAAPTLSGGAGATTRWLAPDTPGATSCAYRVLSVLSDAVTHQPSLMAIGRWV